VFLASDESLIITGSNITVDDCYRQVLAVGAARLRAVVAPATCGG